MESDAAVAVLDATAEELPPQAERASESDMAAAIAAALRFVDFFKVVPPFDLVGGKPVIRKFQTMVFILFILQITRVVIRHGEVWMELHIL